MPNGITENSKPSLVRCAIYTRKSTDEGLDKDFNSLEAQREGAEAYPEPTSSRLDAGAAALR